MRAICAKMRKRYGFTLVELLIVIIIIGILAGSMMLVAGSGTERAEAGRIINDLRTMKSAALMYYADNGRWPPALGTYRNHGYSIVSVKLLEPYMGRSMETWNFANTSNANAMRDNEWFLYVIGPRPSEGVSVSSKWTVFVVKNVSDTYTTFGVRKKLEDMAKNSGIYNGLYTEYVFGAESNIERCIFKALNPLNSSSNEQNRFLVIQAL